MSRVLIMLCALTLSTAPAFGQSAKPKQGAEMIAKSKKITAVDRNGCLKPDDGPAIVVCGESEDTRSQRIFRNQSSDPRFANSAAQNEHAAACIAGTGCVPRMSGGVTMGFGTVPPPAIPLEEVYRGLPEPDQIVPEDDYPNTPEARPE
jgi:hypothetical protein